ncbi:uncharacterized protein EDB93DRAFT_1079184 [Suillus bovinus]|uniref:uncharacterized protein n=1 Tax=Suillus bovinus TaxID=48563 RepID=UPI001B882091|nr:uncharacterized protein EDB93DRAFT_1079184 [Suillus bovinus]KAG2156785.1 hypothetical protein EDB93DRAFT_1079184 [Suillus bovinus]
MECAIKLFADNHMFLCDIDTTGNGRGNKTPLDINPSMGKESSVPLAFSDSNWGAHTRAYMVSINRLPHLVILQNSEFVQSLAMKKHGSQMDVNEETDDERALIC